MKTAEEIYLEMKAEFEKTSGRDISDDCDMAVRMYAAAAQAESLYIYGDWIKDQCFPQTASGEFLDRHAQMRGLTRNQAVKAGGKIRFYIDEARDSELSIPAGTVCLTASGVYFVTTQEAVIEAGGIWCDAQAEAETAGKSGNVAAGTVTYMSPAPVGVTKCANTGAFTGGTDEEDDESLRERVLSSYRRLPNGANKAYYESEALAVAGTAAVCVLPKNRGLGTVDVVISGSDGVPTQELIEEVESRLKASREICVDITVAAPNTKSVDVVCAVKPAEGCSQEAAAAAVQKAVNEFFDGKLLGKSVTRAELGSIIYGVPEVANYTLTSPNADIEAEADELPVLGALTVDAWS
ncbi:MAG: baseplate J/gp47 family protein [Oscillospiraceae bacterium]